MNTHWSGAERAPTVRRKPCRYGCGTEVDTFRDEIGLVRQLDTEPPAITVDLDEHLNRLWEHRGDYVGWCLKFSPRRTWRELRLEHECAYTPERKRKSKRKNTKENKK